MDTASGLVFHIERRSRSTGIGLLLGALFFAVVAFIVAATTVGLLQPASDPILLAPLRWA